MVMLSGSSAMVFSMLRCQFSSVSPSMPGDQVDVDLREVERARELVGRADLRRAVRAAVDLQDAIVEVLDAQAQARDAHLADRRQLVLA